MNTYQINLIVNYNLLNKNMLSIQQFYQIPLQKAKSL